MAALYFAAGTPGGASFVRCERTSTRGCPAGSSGSGNKSLRGVKGINDRLDTRRGCRGLLPERRRLTARPAVGEPGAERRAKRCT